MSWDVSVQRFSKPYASTAEIPENESCQILGTPASVREAISSVFPGTNWSDPRWGVYDGHNGSIEFNMGANEGVDGFMVHVRADESVVDRIVLLLGTNAWQGLDCSNGEYLERSKDTKAGVRGWMAYVTSMLR